MKPNKENLISKLFIGFFILMMLNTNFFSRLYFNGSGEGYGEGGKKSDRQKILPHLIPDGYDINHICQWQNCNWK